MAAFTLDTISAPAAGLLISTIAVVAISLKHAFERRAGLALATLVYGMTVLMLALCATTGGLRQDATLVLLALLAIGAVGLPRRRSLPLSGVIVVAVFALAIHQEMVGPLPALWIIPEAPVALTFAVVALMMIALLHLGAHVWIERQIRARMEAYETSQRRIRVEEMAATLESTFGRLPLPVGIFDHHAVLRYANDSYLKLLDKTLDAVLDKPLGELWPRRAGAICTPKVTEAAEGEASRFTLTFTTPDNVLREFDVFVVPQHQPERQRLDAMMFMVDRTEHVRMERELAEREAMYGAVVDYAPIAILTEINGLITYANPAALLLLEADWSGQVVGRPFAAFVSDEDQARVRSRFGPLGEAPGFAEFIPHRLSTLKGQPRDVELAAVSVTRNGKLLVEIFCTDVTDRRLAEDKVRRLNETLELRVAERTADLEAFATAVSHDLRAPARQAMSAADIMLRKIEQPGADIKPMLTALRATSERMNRTIDALLELSRLGRAGIMPSVWPMDAMVQEIQSELINTEPGLRRVDWKIQPLPRVYADPHLMRLVLVNVLGNAVKFSRKQPKAVVEVWSEESDQMVAINVRDNGAGFDMQQSDKLFNMFSRLHSDREFEGTGVGLAHCKRIVERHGGKISAHGEMNHGATVRFTLPRTTRTL